MKRYNYSKVIYNALESDKSDRCPQLFRTGYCGIHVLAVVNIEHAGAYYKALK